MRLLLVRFFFVVVIDGDGAEHRGGAELEDDEILTRAIEVELAQARDDWADWYLHEIALVVLVR